MPVSGWGPGGRLLVVGPGYSAARFLRSLPRPPAWIGATVRSDAATATAVAAGWQPVPFDGAGPSPELRAALSDATHLLVSVPPGEAGDPVLRHHRADVSAAHQLQAIVYLSTIGVYGDHDGAWVDEATPPRPTSQRSHWRIDAEQAWAGVADAAGSPLAILRLAGIYGPGRNPLVDLAAGTARRVAKPGQVFNRIHVDDIVAAIDAAFARRLDGVVNVTDDEPAPAPDVVAFAAGLMGVELPPEIAFEAAGLSPMGQSFYAECKRVRNARLREDLGVALAHPTYREGLKALWEQGTWGGSSPRAPMRG